MCVVSMVGDFYNKKFAPYTYPNPNGTITITNWDAVTREEFEELKRMVEDMKELLTMAKKYDQENGEPDCEMEEKLKVIRAVAEALDVELPI